ncbi:hypothetical protein C5167_021223 [Papaver somniferum]|nr:hypothetical protein C5167_021223 [Papaver somniferum]
MWSFFKSLNPFGGEDDETAAESSSSSSVEAREILAEPPINGMLYLPRDLLKDIFLRVPMKSIARSRHVARDSGNTLVIWNPCTDEFKKLPVYPPFESDIDMASVEFGIGYDSQAEDFKVVSIEAIRGKNGVRFRFRLRTSSWERLKDLVIEDLSFGSLPDMARIPVNGTLSWIVDKSGFKVIVSFDFEKEEFKEKKMAYLFNESYRTTLCVLKESLCLLGFKHFDRFAGKVGELNLKGKGKTTSGTELFTIKLQNHFGYVRNLMPLQYFGSGEVLLSIEIDDGSFIVLYDPQYDTVTTLYEYLDPGLCCSSHTSIFLKSQISLNTGTYLREYAD